MLGQRGTAIMGVILLTQIVVRFRFTKARAWRSLDRKYRGAVSGEKVLG
jgi:hypothetical protein